MEKLMSGNNDKTKCINCNFEYARITTNPNKETEITCPSCGLTVLYSKKDDKCSLEYSSIHSLNDSRDEFNECFKFSEIIKHELPFLDELPNQTPFCLKTILKTYFDN